MIEEKDIWRNGPDPEGEENIFGNDEWFPDDDDDGPKGEEGVDWEGI